MLKQKPARIVMVLNSFPKLSETFIVNKFLGLLQKNWDVQVVCAESNLSEWKKFPELDSNSQAHQRVRVSWLHRPLWLAITLMPVSLIRCLFGSPRAALRYLFRGWKMFGFDILRRLYLDAEIILLKPDLIHFEFGALAPERMYLKDLLGCKILVSFRGYDLNFSGLNDPDFYQAVWNQADALHVLGQDLWRRALARGCPPNKMHVVIPPALSGETLLNAIERSENPDKPIQILSVGRLEWKKGYEYAMQSIRILLDMGVNCRLRIIGEGSAFEMLVFASRHLKLSNHVEFLGALKHDQVLEQMRVADIFLHSAVSEGFCNAVLEAQAMQIPVVSSDADGLSENIKDGETGFIVPRRNPQMAADKLALLANDPALRRKMGEAGRRRALQYFQLEEQIQRFEEIYSQLLDIQ